MHVEMFSTPTKEVIMKRNANASKQTPSTLVSKLVAVAIAAALSACAVTGPSSSDEPTAEMPFNNVHYGP